MPGNRPNFLNQLIEMWSRLLWPQRLTIILFAFLGLALIGSVVYFMNRVEYIALYRDLNTEDAQAIVAKLEEDKKDYIVQGTSILVAAPQTEIDKLRLEISGSGLAQSGRIGYEIFDKSQFGLTDFTEQVNLQRALEGELARTICSLAEISEARVHIVLPKDTIFKDKEETAKASVVVTLRKGAELSKSSVAGIKGIVSGAVPNLHTYNVSIVDDKGNFLSQSVESGDEARTEMESGLREQLEKEMASKVVSILEPLVGRGKVHANASINMDFNTTEQTEETYNPNPQVVLSQQKSEERSGGSGGASGVPGTQSNLGTSSLQTSNSNAERVRQSEVTNYEVNKLVRHTLQPKGTIHKLSLAVILDHKTVVTKTDDGKTVEKQEPRSQQDIDSYRQLVQAAVGFDEQRGDVISIANVPFYTESKPDEQVQAVPWYLKRQVILMPAMKYGSLIILFLLVYFIILRPVRKRAFQALSYAALGPATEANALVGTSETTENALPGISGTGEIAARASSMQTSSLPEAGSGESEDRLRLESASDEEIERALMKEAQISETGGRKFAVMKRKIVDKAKKDPEMVSQLIRTLLRERTEA
jgi:flagellar M-ring protein FliF